MPYSHPQPIDRKIALRSSRHLLPGACFFAAMAGMINSVVLGFFRTPISHMSGAVSHLGIDLARGQSADAVASLLIVLGFGLGAVVAGAIVGGRDLLPGPRYGGALLVEVGLLAGAVILLSAGKRAGLPLVAMACGLQNGVTSSYCGLVIRTTHVTGMVTDIGVMIGHWIRHRAIEKWKLCFLAAMFVAFGVGGWAGAVLSARIGVIGLLPAALAMAVAGGTMFLFPGRGWLTVEGAGRLDPSASADDRVGV